MKHLARVPLTLAVLLAPPVGADGGFTDIQKIDDVEGGLGAVLFNGDLFGDAVSRIGDLNGDGVNDLAVGAPQAPGSSTGGAVFILLLDTDGTVQAREKILAPAGTVDFGRSLARLGDVDGDGVQDIAAGGTSGGVGIVHVLFLNPDGTLKFSTGTVGTDSSFGAALCGLGDLDGDGIPDLAIGEPAPGFLPSGGRIWIHVLNAAGEASPLTSIGPGQGGFLGALDNGDLFGSSLARVGDLDGNGTQDVAVGAPGDDDGAAGNTGALWILFLEVDGTVLLEQKVSNLNGNLGVVLTGGQDFATSLGRLGDFDLDGVGDLIVGTPVSDGTIWLLLMNADGTVRVTLPYTAQDLGALPGDGFGTAVTGIGDLDGSGTPELVVGAPTSAGGGVDRGAVLVAFPEGAQAAQILPYGCDINAAMSLQTTGLPIPGSTMEFLLDNPLGSQTPSATLPVLAVSLTGVGSPCGIQVPGWSMDPALPGAELLVTLPTAVPLLLGTPWTGAGNPVAIELELPAAPALLGLSAFVQGALVDADPAAAIPIALTRARELVFGI